MAAAELKLQVGLDLAFFRQQLAQLGSVAVGYQMPINVKFDRLNIQQELNRLATNINRRKYKLEIATNIKSETKAAQKLDAALDAIKDKEINVKFTGTGDLNAREANKIRTALRASILTNGGKIKVPATIKAAITQDDISDFKNAVKSKLTGLSVDVKANVQGKGFAGTEQGYEGLMGYMQKQGLLGKTASGMTGQMGKSGDDIKQQLSDAVKSAEKIKSIFDGVAKSIATTGKSTANIQGKNLGLANVPLMAGGVERRIERSTAAIGGTLSTDALKALYPEVNRTITSLAALKGQIQQNTSKLSSFSLIIGLAAFVGVPLAKSVVKLTGSADNFAKLLDKLGLKLDAAFTKAASNILNAASGRLLSGSNVAGLLPAAYRGIESSRNAGVLPPAYRGLPPAYRGIGPSAGAAGLLSPAYRGIKPSTGAAGLLPPAYRGIVGAPAPKGLGGTTFGSQKYLPTALGNETKKVLRDAANTFLDTIKQGIRKVKIQDFGKTINSQAMLSGRNIAGLLPPGVGRTPNAYTTGAIGGETQADRFARREREARAKSSFREMDVLGGGNDRTAASYSYAYRAARPTSAMVPYGPGGALVAGGGGGAPPTAPVGGRGGRGGGMGAFPNISLPGAGLIRELGGEFAMAAKQVLLFGTAYKALAFLTDFPSKVGEAVGQLQTFRNTLQAITPNANEFQQSNQFILDTVAKYNTPLQSARDGFTNLYASMAPAGFKGDEIRNIFSGISQGAATFGMSADKVDRVNYAFAQMASKGQVMSEELKGQLGDVLPGAVAIFAKAAGFTGPNAMVEFTKAMEAGRYKGEAMKQLLINVGIVMKDKFAKGAEGAAQNFQGQMNAMANATKKLYEAFEPAGNLFSSKVIAPFTKGLIVVTDGFNAFFTKQKAVTNGGAELAAKLQELKPTFEGLAANAKAVADRVIELSKAFLPLLELGARLLSSPLIGVLAQTYVSVLLVNGAFTMLATSGIARTVAALVTNLIPATQQSTFLMYRLTLVTRGMWLAMTGPVGLAILAIGAVTAALYAMHEPSREYLDSIPARYKSFWEDLATQASASASKVQAVWQSVQSFFGQIIKNIVQIFQENIGKLPSFFQETIVLIAATFERLMPIFGGVTQWIEANWRAMIASMINSSNPLLFIAERLGVNVGAAYAKAVAGPPPGSKNQLAPGQFTPAGGVSFDAQGKPIGASLSPFVPEVKLPPIPGATGATGGKGSGADDAKRIAEQIKQQLKLAQDLKFEQQNRLTLLRAENDFTKAFTGFSIQRLEIERRYGELLEKSQSKEETAALQESRAAEYKQSRLTLQQRINELLKQAQAPLDDAVESIKNQAAFEREYGELIKNGTNPELAKQLIAIRKGYDESVKLLEPALAAAQAAVTKATAEGASASEIRKYREELERIEAIRKGLAGKKTEGEAAAQEVSTPVFGSKIKTGLDAAREELAKLIDVENILVGAANSIGDAFGSAFKGIVDGSMTAQQALGSLFQNVGNYFVDLVAKMIAEYLKMQLIEGIMNLVSMLSPGFGSGIAPGPVAKSAGVKYSSTKMGPGFANGGIAPGGFRAFATGGIVTGPTLGLVGEGKYNEAVIPLPDGKSVPVDLGGMSGGGAITSNIVINMNSDGQSSSNANGSNSAELGRKIEGAVKQVMVAELRPGGILAGRR
jgi:tape measure domain-containing protein